MLARSLTLSLLLAMPVSCGQAVHGQDLRYLWQPQQKFSYKITITVEEDDKTTKFQGMTHYEVLAANAEQMKVTYRGGLHEQVSPKSGNRLGGPFGPRGFGPGFGAMGPRGFGGPPSPFSRPTFAGKVQTTNQLVITPLGRVITMEGDSHLPFLLGNVSLLPFETLPKADPKAGAPQKEWVVDSGVSISEENESDRGGFGPRGAFGPFGPFSNQENKSVQAATEVTRYHVESQKEDLLSIRKSYQLTSPGNDQESFDMSGAGVWVFDLRDHVPHSLDLSAKLIARQGNSSTTYPISIKYNRVTEAELARLEAEAKRAAEEAERKAAEAKAQAEKPLTVLEKQATLAALSGSDREALTRSLSMLEGKSPLQIDTEIVSALTKLLQHDDKKIVESAQKALVKWSPAFKRQHELKKAYEGPGPVASSDLEVESTTPLYVGQLVQFQESGSFWYAGRIKQLLPGNKVQVESLAWGKPNRELTLARRNIQLAPPELEQPVKPQPASPAQGVEVKSDMRTWTDKTGRFRIEASFISVEGATVKLLRKDGKQATVPLDKLSDTDQAFIRQMLDENPFEIK